MNGKKVKRINKFLEGLQGATRLSDKRMKNVRRNVKRIATRSNEDLETIFSTLDINHLIEKSGW